MLNVIDLKLMADDAANAYRRAGFRVRTVFHRYTFPIATVQERVIDNLPVYTTQQITTDRDSIFAWLSTSVFFLDFSLPSHRWFAGANLQLRDESSGYELVGPDRDLPHQILAGVDGAPVIHGFPYILAPGSRVTAAWRDGGDEGDAHLSLNGIKIFTDPYTRRAILPDVPEVEAA